jgi:hypothetical protein
MELSVDFAYETTAVNQKTAKTFGTTPGTMLPDREVGFPRIILVRLPASR